MEYFEEISLVSLDNKYYCTNLIFYHFSHLCDKQKVVKVMRSSYNLVTFMQISLQILW